MKKISSKKRLYNPYVWLRYLIISACTILLSFIFLISIYGKEIVALLNESAQPVGDGTRYLLGFIPLPLITDILQKEQRLFLTAIRSVLSLFDSVK
ncbi:MAG: hypothetical protein WA061_03645 [Microgenomates group bacterium]